MLLKLPNEIIVHLLNFLPFHDRLSLVKTCRVLRNVISERNFYDELPTFELESKLQDAIEFFGNHSAYASQVRRLNVKTKSITTDILSQLPCVFPNIREFKANRSMYFRELEIETMSQWKDTLEKCNIKEGRLLIPRILDQNVFSRLSSLTIPICESQNYKYTSDLQQSHYRRTGNRGWPISPYDISKIKEMFHFINCFRNTPSLKHLELHGSQFYVEYLEKLHSVCPKLASLNLSVCLGVGDIDALSSLIEPAIQLDSLKLTIRSHNFVSHLGIFNYLISKYTNLTELVFLGNVRTSGYRGDDVFPEFQKEKEEFLSNLSSTIKILKLSTYIFENPLEKLKESTINPTELAFYDIKSFRDLFPSAVVLNANHLEYLKNLDFLKSLTLEWNSIMEEHNDGPLSESISNLTVQIPDSDVYTLDTILSAFPSLESLVVTKKNLSAETISLAAIKNPISEAVYPNLRKLSLYHSFYDSRVINFIARSSPNMKELELGFEYVPMDTDPDPIIDLQGCSVNVLNLVFRNLMLPKCILSVYLQLEILDELNGYEVDILEFPEYHVVYPVPNILDIQDSKIKITCDKTITLKIGGEAIELAPNNNHHQ